ncbi:hypothetical protein [Longibaculum muris]|uniref:hypothetical protein n=1 Tax=Longibaculum muris TaxID=1796628 RepID=UPI0018A01AFB|nr:hypothetical protein [Longibaculum muris]
MTTFSMVAVFAYGRLRSTTLYKSSSIDAVTDWIGYDYIAKNDASSSALMEAATWASWKGAIFPNTKEAVVTISWGKSTPFSDSQKYINLLTCFNTKSKRTCCWKWNYKT